MPVLLLGAAMAVAAAMILGFAWHTTFFADTWELLMDRRDPSVDTLLRPHNEHLVVIPIAINELFLRIFGMGADKPELILLVAFLCVTAGLLYIFVERRLGPWPALFAAVLVLFLGPAFEVLLWPFEVTFVGPMMFGLAALVALDRPSRRNDAIACACLVLGLGFSNLGVPFIAAGFVAVMAGPREHWRARAYIWAVPLLLFAAWYVGWGHEAESHVGIHNVLAAPAFVANMVSVAVGSLTGLGTEPNLTVDLSWGHLFALGLVVAVVLWWRRARPPVDRMLWPVVAVAVVNWVLAAFNAFAGREPTSSRYEYAGAIFVLLILACLFSGARPSRSWLWVGGIATLLAVGPNIVVLHEASKNYKREAVITRADTAAIEIARRTIQPDLQLTPENAGTGTLVNVTAEKYLQAVDEYGSPAYTVPELESAPPEGRRQADILLFDALPVSAELRYGGYDRSPGGSCAAAGGGQREEVTLPFGTTRVEVPPGTEAKLALRRFASEEFPVGLPPAPEDSETVIEVPQDEARLPWRLHIEAPAPVLVCG